MNNGIQIILWSKVGCPYCIDVKDFLLEHKLSYTEIDVTEHEDRRDILEAKYNTRYVPVIEIGKNNQFTGVTELGVEALKVELLKQNVLP